MRIFRTKAKLLAALFSVQILLGAALAAGPQGRGPNAPAAKVETTAATSAPSTAQPTLAEALREIASHFTLLDWAVIVLYLAMTTVLGAALAGRQATIRDFFLGGRKLPWPAVCGSIIATELSVATFLIVPAIVFSEGGDLTYLQLAIGTILARFVIGWFFVPAFYEREIYSPYDYMGNRLGDRVKRLTTGLFVLGAILAQGARVYIAALALQVITGADIVWAIVLIGSVSILWTWIGGIRTVIWTDVIQFTLFTIGSVVALAFVCSSVPGGLGQLWRESLAAGKLKLINTTFDTKTAYTLWCGLFATGWLTLASHGTDQMTAQRIFTCRGPAEARKAIVWSSAGQLITLLLLLVGVGLWAFYRHNPPTAAEQVVLKADSMKVFAVFIVDVLPPGFSGLVMAGIFAAAISTLDSVLAALAQSTLAVLYKPLRRTAPSAGHELLASRFFVVFWGVVLTAFAIACDAIQRRYADLIQFALAMSAYTYGALLGTFLLALLPLGRNDLGLVWGIPLSILTVFVLSWHGTVAQIVTAAAAVALIVSAIWQLRHTPWKAALIAALTAAVLLIEFLPIGRTPSGDTVYFELAWPWHFPIGTAVTFAVGVFVGERAGHGAGSAAPSDRPKPRRRPENDQFA